MDNCNQCHHPADWHAHGSYQPTLGDRLFMARRTLARVTAQGCRAEGCECVATWADLHEDGAGRQLAAGAYCRPDGTYIFTPAFVLEVADSLGLSARAQIKELLAAVVQRALDLEGVPPLPSPPAGPLMLLDVDESIDLEQRDGMFRAA